MSMKNTQLAEQLRATGLAQQATSNAQDEINQSQACFATLQAAIAAVITNAGFKAYNPRLEGFDKPSEADREAAERSHKAYTRGYLGQQRADIIRRHKDGSATPEDTAYRLVASDFIERAGMAIPAIAVGLAKAGYELSRGRLSGVINTLQQADDVMARFGGFSTTAEGIEAYASKAVSRVKQQLARKRQHAEGDVAQAAATQAKLFNAAMAGDNDAKNRLKAADVALEKANRHLSVVDAAIATANADYPSDFERAANALLELYKLEQYAFVGKQRRKVREARKGAKPGDNKAKAHGNKAQKAKAKGAKPNAKPLGDALKEQLAENQASDPAKSA